MSTPMPQPIINPVQLAQLSQQQVGRYVIHKPFIDLNRQHVLFRKFQKTYNAMISTKRAPIRLELRHTRQILATAQDAHLKLQMQVREATLKETLQREDHQLLKECHFAMMFEICRRIVQQVQVSNQVLADTTLVHLDPAKPYTLRTNNAELAYNKGGTKRSMYNQRKRLEAVGFILDTKHNGGLKDFELIINPAFLQFSEYEEPERGFLCPMLQTVECGLSLSTSESFTAKEKKKDFNTSIMPVSGVLTSQNSIGSPNGQKEHEKEHQGIEKSEEPKQALCLQTFEKITKDKGRAEILKLKSTITSAKNYKLFSIYQILVYFMRELMQDYDINAVTLQKTAQMMYESYFIGLENRQNVDDFYLLSLQAVEKQIKYIEFQKSKGKTAFTKLPINWFAFQKTVKEQVKANNYSTYHAQLVRINNDKKLKNAKKTIQHQAKLQKEYERLTQIFKEDPSTTNYTATVQRLSKLHPDFAEKFNKDLANFLI